MNRAWYLKVFDIALLVFIWASMLAAMGIIARPMVELFMWGWKVWE